MFPNHYARLGLSREATRDQIKKAYRSLALKFHPDVNKKPDAHERFIEINEAYLILYDVEARSKYDFEYDLRFSNQEPVGTEQCKGPSVEDPKTRDQSSSDDEHIYTDETLNDWSKKARQQGQQYANMAFVDFSQLIVGFVKETGFQLGNSLLVFFGIFFAMGGCGNLIFSLTSEGETGNPLLGLMALAIGLLLYYLANRNWERH
jgi:DnaJ-class molecular chaperone